MTYLQGEGVDNSSPTTKGKIEKSGQNVPLNYMRISIKISYIIINKRRKMKKEEKKNLSPVEAEAARDKLISRLTLVAMALQTVIFATILILQALGL